MRLCLVLFWLMFFTANSSIAPNEQLNYYRLEFDKNPDIKIQDSLFSKTIWHKKVSHIVIEDKFDEYRVSLLMIQPYPYNYKSKNYSIYFQFDKFADAMKKFIWLDRFLRINGVMRVHLNGNRISREKIVFEGYPELLTKD